MKGSNLKLTNSNDLYKSKESDRTREKISTFKPKTLHEIYEQNKGRKDSNEPKIQSPAAKVIEKTPPPAKVQTKNSLQSLIQSSGRSFQVQSLQMDNSEFDDEFDPDNCQFQKKPATTSHHKFGSQTPQYTPFSKSNNKQSNPFICKDDANFNQFLTPQNEWNGKIAMTSSVTYEQEETAQERLLKKSLQKIGQFIRPFLCKGYYYVMCENETEQNQFLLQKNKNPFTIEQLKQKLCLIQGRLTCGLTQQDIKKVNQNQCIKFIESQDDESYFLNDADTSQQQAHQQFQRHLVKSILPLKKYVKLYYHFDSSFMIKFKSAQSIS